jgi:hypothetical protein
LPTAKRKQLNMSVFYDTAPCSLIHIDLYETVQLHIQKYCLLLHTRCRENLELYKDTVH